MAGDEGGGDAVLDLAAALMFGLVVAGSWNIRGEPSGSTTFCDCERVASFGGFVEDDEAVLGRSCLVSVSI